jgi:murein DD-endopeptidase MepM/ murein hydrolase activator NlpD
VIAAAAAALPLAAAPGAGAARFSTGGTEWVAVPEIRTVACMKECGSAGRPRAGGVVRVTGRNMAGVTKVVFHGGRGTLDDKVARPRSRRERSLTAPVPMGAATGPVSVWAGEEVRSRRSKPLAVLPPPAPIVNPELTPAPGPRDPGAPQVETGTSQAKLFFGAERSISFSYRVSGGGPVAAKVDLVRAADGVVVQSWTPETRPGEVQTITWNGVDAAGVPQPEGRYVFRLVASGSDGAQARSAQVQDVQRDAFDLYGHIFPVRARHDYGGDGARFGAGRAGHSHQGQDVFARCGARLVAARGGIVKFKQYHAAAGQYLVIDGEQSGFDYAYMHLQAASPFEVGDRVFTGQEIGRVGDTGNAHGCHLHFEVWGEPGWYDGGSPLDPLPLLQQWDAVS